MCMNTTGYITLDYTRVYSTHHTIIIRTYIYVHSVRIVCDRRQWQYCDFVAVRLCVCVCACERGCPSSADPIFSRPGCFCSHWPSSFVRSSLLPSRIIYMCRRWANWTPRMRISSSNIVWYVIWIKYVSFSVCWMIRKTAHPYTIYNIHTSHCCCHSSK